MRLAAPLGWLALVQGLRGLLPPASLRSRSGRIVVSIYRGDSFEADSSIRIKVKEIRQLYQLDQLSTYELKAQITARSGNSKGLYEKIELIDYLAYLIVRANETQVSESVSEQRDKVSRAELIVAKKRLMKHLSTDDIRRQLTDAGLSSLTYRGRDDMESALALLWLGDIQSVTPADAVTELTMGLQSFIGNISSSVSSAFGTSQLVKLNGALTMTDAERAAKDILSSKQPAYDHAPPDIEAARTQLSSASTLDQVDSIAAKFSKSLILDLLSNDFNIQADPKLSRSELITLLGDSVVLRWKIAENYYPSQSDFVNVVQPPSNSVAVRDSRRVASEQMKETLFPEKEFFSWVASSFERLVDSTKKGLQNSGLPDVIDTSVSAGLQNFVSVTLSIGVEAVNSLAAWAVGSKEKAPLALFAICSLTIAFRRGVLFFASLLLGLRAARVSLFGADNIPGSVQGRQAERVRVAVLVVLGVLCLLQLTSSTRLFPRQKLYLGGVGYR